MANLEVLALDTVTPQIRAPGAGDGYSVPRDMTLASGTTLTAPTVNATTVDATNVEVTNVKAKDGTAAITIADSTGNVGIGTASPQKALNVVVSSSSTTIGGSDAVIQVGNSNGAALNLTAGIELFGSGAPSSGLGNRSGGIYGIYEAYNAGGNAGALAFATNPAGTTSVVERMRIDSSGNVGIGGAAQAFAKVDVSGTLPTGSNTSVGFYSRGGSPSGTTADHIGFWAAGASAASTTLTRAQGFLYSGITVGAGGTITNQYGVRVTSAVTGATNNYAFYSDIASGSNRWNLYCAGTAENYVANNLKIGGTAARATTAGTNQLVLFNGTAPVGTLANGVSFYSASGEANVMDAAGNATLLSPHDSETNEWIFRSKHTPSGKVLRIDVEKMLRFINEHFDLDMVQEWTE